MATATASVPAGDRRILLVALALLGGATGAIFGRVFLGTLPAVRLAVAGVAAVAIAASLARRPLIVSLVASAAGLLLALGILVFPGTTWGGLPTLDTFRAIGRALDVVTQRAATEIAPARPLAPLMTAALMAVWSAGVAAHSLAIRSGSSLLPLLPGAALLGFAGVVTEDPPRPGYVLLFLAAAFAVLFAEALQRVSSWGPDAPSARTIFSGRWARAIGVTAALLAIAIPGVLPGFRAQAILEVDHIDGRIGVSPIVDIRPSLLQNPVAELFRVRADRPSYWRMVVLDRFDGRLWTQSQTEPAGKELLGTGVAPLTTVAPPHPRFLDQEIEISDLATQWLPAAADPVTVALDEGGLGATHDLRTGMLSLEDAETTEGLRYRITSAQPWPTVQELEGATPNNPVGDPRYVELPTGLPSVIRQIARDISGGADSPFQQVLAIQEYLRGFTYDETVQAGHATDDMQHFLLHSQRGYCEQFAGTMAVLVRAIGYPARVAIGFLPGDRGDDGRYRVTTAQVHAWPEVHFPGHGWLPFEPTPGRANPNAEYLLPPTLRHRGAGNAGNGGANEPGAGSIVERREGPALVPPVVDPGQRGGSRPRREPFSWWRLVLILLAVSAAVGVVAIPSRAIGRRLAMSRAPDGRRRVLAAYAWLLGGAAELGQARRRGETLLEYGQRLLGSGDVAPAQLETLTRLAGQALYSSSQIADAEAADAVGAARTVLRQLRQNAGPARTFLGALRPAPRPA